MMPRAKVSVWASGMGTLFHRVHLFISHLGRFAMVFAGAWGSVWDLSLAVFDPRAADYLWDVAAGSFFSFLLDAGAPMTIEVHGRDATAPAWQVRDYAAAHFPWFGFLFWGFASLALCLGLGVIATRLLVRRGVVDLADRFVRGQRVVAPEDVTALIPSDDRSPFTIGGVPIPSSKLARNVLCVGSMGSGKSQEILHLMDAARASGKKAVIYDLSGEFVERYFQEGDVLLNPLDARCAPWTVFNDIRKRMDPAALAEFFVPQQSNKQASSDPMWENAARMLLEDIIRIVGGRPQNERSMAEILHILSMPLEDLFGLLERKKAVSAGLINDKNPKGAESVRMTLLAQPAIRFFSIFDSSGSFSIRGWVKNRDDKGWLFISSRTDQHATIKPFVSAWLEIAMMAIMEQRPTSDLRMMLVLDELASLQKMRALETALTFGRKYGLFTVVGIQNAAQVDEIYGEDVSKVLIANLQTKLVLRTEEETSARRLADILGKEDVEEVQENINLGGEDEQHTSALVRNRKERYCVLPSEIQILPDLEGFLKIAGDLPVCKVRIEYKARPIIAPEYVEREGLDFLAGGDAEEGPGQDPFGVDETVDGPWPEEESPHEDGAGHGEGNESGGVWL